MGTIFAYFYHAPLDNSRRYNKFDRRAANLNLTSNSSWGQDGGLSNVLNSRYLALLISRPK